MSKEFEKMLQKLSCKYEKDGLSIFFLFNKYEMILEGYLGLPSTSKLYRYNRAYSYGLLNNLSEEINIETLVDDFKDEVFKAYAERKG